MRLTELFTRRDRWSGRLRPQVLFANIRMNLFWMKIAARDNSVRLPITGTTYKTERRLG
jgi:hypothetical protein